MLIRFKIGNEKYEIDEDDLTTGEAYLLKREYELTDFGDLSYKDPSILLGLEAIAIRRKHPDLSEAEAHEKAEGVKSAPIFEDLTKQFEKIIADAKAKQADPPLPAESASTAGGGSGSGEKTPVKRGSPSGRKS